MHLALGMLPQKRIAKSFRLTPAGQVTQAVLAPDPEAFPSAVAHGGNTPGIHEVVEMGLAASEQGAGFAPVQSKAVFFVVFHRSPPQSGQPVRDAPGDGALHGHGDGWGRYRRGLRVRGFRLRGFPVADAEFPRADERHHFTVPEMVGALVGVLPDQLLGVEHLGAHFLGVVGEDAPLFADALLNCVRVQPEGAGVAGRDGELFREVALEERGVHAPEQHAAGDFDLGALRVGKELDGRVAYWRGHLLFALEGHGPASLLRAPRVDLFCASRRAHRRR